MNVENKRDDRKKKIREIAGGILCIAVLLFIVSRKPRDSRVVP